MASSVPLRSTIPRASADPETSASIWGLVPRRHPSGEVDYVGGISKCGDRRMRTLHCEAANVMLTR
jgi:transposase